MPKLQPEDRRSKAHILNSKALAIHRQTDGDVTLSATQPRVAKKDGNGCIQIVQQLVQEHHLAA
jgi:hypothetical protein